MSILNPIKFPIFIANTLLKGNSKVQDHKFYTLKYPTSKRMSVLPLHTQHQTW